MIYFGYQKIVNERMRLQEFGENAAHGSLEHGRHCCQPVVPRFKAV